MNLSGWNSARLASAEAVVAGEPAVRPMSPVSIPAHLTVVERPVECLRDGRLHEPLAQPDPELAGRGP